MRYTSQNLSLLRIRSKAPHVLWKKDSTMGFREGSSSCYYRGNNTDAAHSVKLQRYFEEMVKTTGSLMPWSATVQIKLETGLATLVVHPIWVGYQFLNQAYSYVA